MSVNKGFILAAGFGTRMGEISQKLPKPLWPIFEKSLIELQISYLHQLGITDIYANVHHHRNLLDQEMKKSHLPLTILHEEEILDVGGGIINLAKNSTGGIFFIQNVDQFLFFDPSIYKNALKMINEYSVVLFAIKVNKNQGYNKLLLNQDETLAGVEKWSANIAPSYYTYAGCSLVKTDHLKSSEIRKINFFESVADYKNKAIGIIYIDEYEYWDFGTAQSYFDNHRKIIFEENSGSKLRQFLVENKALKLSKIGDGSYNAVQNNLINLTNKNVERSEIFSVPQIHLTVQETLSTSPAILFEELSSPVSLDQMAQV